MAETLSQARVSVCPLLEIPKFATTFRQGFRIMACGVPVVAAICTNPAV